MGVNIRTKSGKILEFRLNGGIPNSNEFGDDFNNNYRILEEGRESIPRIKVINEDLLNKDGENHLENSTLEEEKCYILGDDVTHFTPDYEGFNGEGVWVRIVENNNYLSLEDGGVIPVAPYDRIKYDYTKRIQAVLDNPFYSVRANMGQYYVTDTLYLRRSKQFLFPGFNVPSILPARRGREMLGSIGSTIWTDQNIKVVEYQGTVLYKSAFNIDCQYIPFHTKSAFNVNLKYSDNRLIFMDLNVAGNPHTLTSSEDVGTRAFVIDSRGAKPTSMEESLYGVSTGWMHTSKVNLSFLHCHTGLWRTPDVEGEGGFTNGLEINMIRCDETKQWCNIERSYGSLYITSRTVQHKYLLSNKQRETMATFSLFGRLKFDGYPMDFNEGRKAVFAFHKNGWRMTNKEWNNTISIKTFDFINEPEKYVDDEGKFTQTIEGDTYTAIRMRKPKHFVELRSDNITFGHTALRSISTRKDIFKNPEFIQESRREDLTGADFVIPKYGNLKALNSTKSRTKVSLFDNSLVYLDKKLKETYIKSFKSLNDFDVTNLLEKSDGTNNPNITKTNKPRIQGGDVSKILSPSDNRTVFVQYGEDDDNINSYVELFLDASNDPNLLDNDGVIHISLSNLNISPNKVQVICLDDNDNVVTNNITDTYAYASGKVYELNIDERKTSKIIIRFIGANSKFDVEISETLDEFNVGQIADENFTGGRFYIQDIMLCNSTGNMTFLHRDGGQDVYGDINFKRFASPTWEKRNGEQVKFSGEEIESIKDVVSRLGGPVPVSGSKLSDLKINNTSTVKFFNGVPDGISKNFDGSESSAFGAGLAVADGSGNGFMLWRERGSESTLWMKNIHGGYVDKNQEWVSIWSSNEFSKEQFDEVISASNSISHKSVRVVNVNEEELIHNADNNTVIYANAGIGDIKILMPNPENSVNSRLTIIRIDNTDNNVKCIRKDEGKISGNTERTFIENQSETYICDGIDWRIESNYIPQ